MRWYEIVDWIGVDIVEERNSDVLERVCSSEKGWINGGSMYMCEYVCIYVCMYVCMYACMCMYVRVHLG